MELTNKNGSSAGEQVADAMLAPALRAQDPAHETNVHPHDGCQSDMPIVVRQSTRAVFDALRAQGDVPSVRKLHAQLGGSYNRLAEEVRALRVELAAGLPAMLPALPDEQAPGAGEAQRSAKEASDQVLLAVPPRAADALEKLRHALRTKPIFYRDVELALMRVQRGETALTDLLAAWVGQDA